MNANSVWERLGIKGKGQSFEVVKKIFTVNRPLKQTNVGKGTTGNVSQEKEKQSKRRE